MMYSETWGIRIDCPACRKSAEVGIGPNPTIVYGVLALCPACVISQLLVMATTSPNTYLAGKLDILSVDQVLKSEQGLVWLKSFIIERAEEYAEYLELESSDLALARQRGVKVYFPTPTVSPPPDYQAIVANLTDLGSRQIQGTITLPPEVMLDPIIEEEVDDFRRELDKDFPF